jgi:hypothetical protein
MIANVISSVSPAKTESKSIKKKKKLSTKSLKLDEVDLKMFQAKLSANASVSPYDRAARNRPGTSAMDWEVYPVDEVTPGPQSIQQKIQFLIKTDVHNVKLLCTLPEGENAILWQYEHLRQITMELNDFILCLQPQCTSATCPLMSATDKYEFRCAAHESAQDCCAMDYMIHTLDSTIATLNSTKLFPSRLTLKNEDIKQCQALARRLYRFFPHAYYSHKSLFDEFESRTR